MPLSRVARACKKYWKESLGMTLVVIGATLVADPSHSTNALLFAPATFVLLAVFFAAFIPVLEDVDTQRRAKGMNSGIKDPDPKP